MTPCEALLTLWEVPLALRCVGAHSLSGLPQVRLSHTVRHEVVVHMMIFASEVKELYEGRAATRAPCPHPRANRLRAKGSWRTKGFPGAGGQPRPAVCLASSFRRNRRGTTERERSSPPVLRADRDGGKLCRQSPANESPGLANQARPDSRQRTWFRTTCGIAQSLSDTHAASKNTACHNRAAPST